MRPAKIVIYTLASGALLLSALLAVKVTINTMAVVLAKLTGLDLTQALGEWGGMMLLIIAIFLMPREKLAWNHKYCIQGETVIDASIEEVWDWLKLRERDDYFSSTTRRIRAVEDREDEFHLLFDSRLKDENDGMPDHIHVRVLDEEIYEYMAFHALNAEDMPLFGKDHLMTEILLEQLLDGVRVRYMETLSRVTLGGFLALLFLNPARDAMKSLKAQIEGQDNPSVMNQMLEGMRTDGTPSVEVTRAVRLAGITAMTCATVGLIYFVSSITAG